MKSIVNFQQKTDEAIEQIMSNKSIPTLLLHSCCAPCSSYVLEYLSKYFKITIFYYNPNISPESEYRKRVEEQQRFINSINWTNEVSFIEGSYEPMDFYSISKGLEEVKEGGERCYLCYELRMREAARYASVHNFNYFTTTLSISPHKNANWINEIGDKLTEEYKVNYLYSDFKKKNGYKRSIELSREYNLYRQDYCGCVYSKNTIQGEV